MTEQSQIEVLQARIDHHERLILALEAALQEQAAVLRALQERSACCSSRATSRRKRSA